MEASLSLEPWFTKKQSMEGYPEFSFARNMPCSSLVEDQRLQLPFINSCASPSSPSLDMEAALQQLSHEPLDVASNSESSSFSEDSDVLMIDPLLDYINEVLMDEGMEDATCMQQDADASYRAIMSGFYELIGEHSPPNSSDGSTSYENNSDLHVPHQISTYYEDGLDEQHVNASERDDEVANLTNEGHKLGFPRVSLPANGNPHGGLMVSSRVEDAGIDGIINHTSYSGKEQGNGHFEFPAEDKDLALKRLDISFEDLKLKADYTTLYVEEPSSSGRPTSAVRSSTQNGGKKKNLTVAGKRSRNSGDMGPAQVQGFVDLREVLVSCAQAVAGGDMRRANEILQELRQVHGASAKGNGLQRTAHYFSEALVARMTGLGGHQFRAISHNMPSAATLLRAQKVGFEVAPQMKIMHYFANQSILKAAEGASRVHIVDYGLLYGLQWPCLINALADRKGGPPLLVITGIEFPQPGHKPAEKLEESGRRLSAYARTYNVPFEYHAIATSKWEDLDTASFHHHEDEVLVINCMKRLRHLADETVDMALTPPRQKLLTRMCSLNPDLLLFAEVSAGYNSPFFVSRFREALYYYSNVFDMLDTLWGDNPERLIMERSFINRDILNVVACEGAERVERPETYKQWQVRIKRAGFEQLPICPTILSRARSHVKQHYHKDFSVLDDANRWMLLGWKGRTTLALSVWKPSPA